MHLKVFNERVLFSPDLPEAVIMSLAEAMTVQPV